MTWDFVLKAISVHYVLFTWMDPLWFCITCTCRYIWIVFSEVHKVCELELECCSLEFQVVWYQSDDKTIIDVCFVGVNTIAPSDNDTRIGGDCMPGYYWPEGSERPSSCPPGQYRSVMQIYNDYHWSIQRIHYFMWEPGVVLLTSMRGQLRHNVI